MADGQGASGGSGRGGRVRAGQGRGGRVRAGQGRGGRARAGQGRGGAGAARRTVMWATILAAGLGPAGAAAYDLELGEHAFTLGGFFNVANAVRIADQPDSVEFDLLRRTFTVPPQISSTPYELPDVLVQQNQLRLSISGSHPGDVFSQVNVDLLYNSNPERPFDDEVEVEIDEAYMDFRAARADWRVGKEKVVWGKADLMSPFDRLTGSDLLSPLVNEPIEDRRGQWGVKANVGWSDYSLEAAFYPVWTRSRAPQAHTDSSTAADAWFFPAAILPTVPILITPAPGADPFIFAFVSTYHRNEFPDSDLDTAGYGARFNVLKGIWDTDFYFVSTIEPVPHPEVTARFAEDLSQPVRILRLDVDFRFRHARLRTFGVSTAATMGRLAFRAEAAYTDGLNWYRLFSPEQIVELIDEFEQSGAGTIDNTGEEHAAVTGIVGGDVDLPGTGVFLSTQFLFDFGFDHTDVFFQNALEASMTNLLRKGWMDDHLVFTWFDFVSLTGQGVMLRPQVTYTPPAFEDLQLDAGVNAFVGDSFSMIAQFKHHAAAFFSARVYF